MQKGLLFAFSVFCLCALIPSPVRAADALLEFHEKQIPLRVACEKGERAACEEARRLGDEFRKVHPEFDHNSYEQVVPVFSKKCDAGSVEHCWSAYIAIPVRGVGLPIDPRRLPLARKACDLGKGSACAAVLTLSPQVTGKKMDISEAKPLAEKACAGGSPTGCALLIVFNGKHTGGKIDLPKLIGDKERSCDAGNGQDCYEAGLAFFSFELGPLADQERGLSYLKKGCDTYRHAKSCEAKARRGLSRSETYVAQGQGSIPLGNPRSTAPAADTGICSVCVVHAYERARLFHRGNMELKAADCTPKADEMEQLEQQGKECDQLLSACMQAGKKSRRECMKEIGCPKFEGAQRMFDCIAKGSAEGAGGSAAEIGVGPPLPHEKVIGPHTMEGDFLQPVMDFAVHSCMTPCRAFRGAYPRAAVNVADSGRIAGRVPLRYLPAASALRIESKKTLGGESPAPVRGEVPKAWRKISYDARLVTTEDSGILQTAYAYGAEEILDSATSAANPKNFALLLGEGAQVSYSGGSAYLRAIHNGKLLGIFPKFHSPGANGFRYWLRLSPKDSAMAWVMSFAAIGASGTYGSPAFSYYPVLNGKFGPALSSVESLEFLDEQRLKVVGVADGQRTELVLSE